MNTGGKRIDLTQLQEELALASVPVRGLGLFEDDVFTYDDDGSMLDLPPEARPVVDAHDATKKDRAAVFETAEDAERLRLVNERARTDPAYAALADLALGKDR